MTQRRFEDTILSLHKVHVSLNRREILRDISWTVGAGFHALLGPNGAGKTTLLSTIATLTEPSAGKIVLDGNEGAHERRAHLGYLAQDNLPRSRFTVYEYLHYAAWLRGLDDQQSRSAILEVLPQVDLREYAHSQLRSLSGGMRRRVGIAATMIDQPTLLILDEPSAGLDIAQRRQLQDTAKAYSSDRIVIMSTHIVEDIFEAADTITVINNGRILFSGPKWEFGSGSLSAFNESYRGLLDAEA